MPHDNFANVEKNEIKPWQVKQWCIGKPCASFVAKMEDVLSVYHPPYDPQRPVVCVDKGGKEFRDTPNDTLPTQPGQPACQDYEYERNGKANLFVSVEPLVRRRRVVVTERRTACDFAEEVRLLVDEDYPDAEVVVDAEVIVLVVDNLNAHNAASLYERFELEEARGLARKTAWHSTPEHGSWLNRAECDK